MQMHETAVFVCLCLYVCFPFFLFDSFNIVLLLFIGFLTFTGAFFIVNETKQALVLQFGDPRKVITNPGLQFKIPFILSIFGFII